MCTCLSWKTVRAGVIAALCLLAVWTARSFAVPAETGLEDDSPFAKAESEWTDARAKELAASEDYDSYQMSHAAAREIARSERQRVDREMQRVKAAESALKAAVDAKRESELDALRAELDERWTTFRKATDQMLEDSRISTKASEEVLIGDADIQAKMALSREAEQRLLEAKAAAAEKANAPDALNARLAVKQLELLRGMEAHQWPILRGHWAAEFVDDAHQAASLAKKIEEMETDAERKKALTQFAAEQETKQAETAKVVAETQKRAAAAEPKLYALRAAAHGGLPLLPPEEWDYAKARHLLVRAGFGGTPDEVEKLHKMGLYKAVDYLVEYYRQPGANIAFDPVPPLRGDPLHARMTVRTMTDRAVSQRRAVERGQVGALRQAWLRRMVESPRPLQDKLALFWHGLFASQDSVVQNSYTLHKQIQLFREHAAGNYGAMLYGIVHDPAMLRYLDNNQNVKGQPNENLAREILELFSMGVDQGYTEKDIIEAARALTGYTYDDATGAFQYVRALHDDTEKTIFGQSGNWTGDDLVRLILERPETSAFIAKRLFEYFARQDPEPEIIGSLATVLRVNQYDLEPMLKNLFMSAEFYSPRTMGSQIKSPVELVVGMYRDLGVRQGVNYGAIDGSIQQMGMQLLEPPDVKGWRYGRAWINSQRLFSRYNATASLVRTGATAGGQTGADVFALVQKGGCQDASQVVDFLVKACLLRPLTPEKRAELVNYLGELPPAPEWEAKRAELLPRLQSLVVLMISTPEYQML